MSVNRFEDGLFFHYEYLMFVYHSNKNPRLPEMALCTITILSARPVVVPKLF